MKMIIEDAPISLSREHYTADACIVWCFDNRFWPAFLKFIADRGFRHFDPVFTAGGAKSLASPELETDRQFILRQIKKSIDLHQAKKVILAVHSDCGGYGCLAAFGGDEKAEFEKLSAELKTAADIVRKNIPSSVEVETLFASFDGSYPI